MDKGGDLPRNGDTDNDSLYSIGGERDHWHYHITAWAHCVLSSVPGLPCFLRSREGLELRLLCLRTTL